MTDPSQEHLPGFELMDSLRAEDEARLDLFFIPPPDFPRISGPESSIVFGDPGSGKTILYRVLQSWATGAGPTPNNLLVFWRLTPIPAEIKDGAQVVKRLSLQLVDACGMALLANIAERPADFNQAPDWVQEKLVWYIKYAVRGNLAARMGPLMDAAEASGRTTLQRIQKMQVEEILYDPQPEQAIAELISGLKRIGMEGVWVMSDGLEGWAEADPDQLTKNLVSFLSALSIFERAGLVFKFFIPSHLEPSVIRASGVLRRRVVAYYLHWDWQQLLMIVEKRMAVILNQDAFTLRDLCAFPDLASWLDRVGGSSPREWLDQIQPLLKHYIQHKLTAPVPVETWKQLLTVHPPYFWMDESGNKVKVGGREVPLDDVPPKAYDMLRYLYKHSGQVVGKDELYYLVYLEKESIPRSPKDGGYEPPSIYAGLIDTNIYRLRQAIEPNPAEPVLLQTVRGHGVKLVSRL